MPAGTGVFKPPARSGNEYRWEAPSTDHTAVRATTASIAQAHIQ